MLSPSRITLENNGKIRPQPDRENSFSRASGGAGGIRTHETLSRPLVFKTSAFNHSATAPCGVHSAGARGGQGGFVRVKKLANARFAHLCSLVVHGREGAPAP